MPGFLTIGVTIACFIEVGKVAECSDALTSFASIGVIVAFMSLISHVGAGSSPHCLLGHRASNRAMSCDVTGRLVVLHGRSDTGVGPPAVDARMVSTLPLKCAANAAGVMLVVGRTGGDNRLDIAFQSVLESPVLS